MENKFLYKSGKIVVKKCPIIKCRTPKRVIRPNGIVVKDSKKPYFMIIKESSNGYK